MSLVESIETNHVHLLSELLLCLDCGKATFEYGALNGYRFYLRIGHELPERIVEAYELEARDGIHEVTEGDELFIALVVDGRVLAANTIDLPA